MAKFGWDERKLFFVDNISLETLSADPGAPSASEGGLRIYSKNEHLYIRDSVAEVLMPEDGLNIGAGAQVFKQKNSSAQLEFRKLKDAGNGYVGFTENADDISIDVNVGTLEADIDHGNLDGLGDDDHTQYHNDTRGDARYYQKSEFINVSAGAGDAGKPIVLDATGKIDPSMLDFGDIDHGSLDGLDDDDHQYYLWLPGRSGGQIANGGTDASDDLELRSTANATKGEVKIIDDSDFRHNNYLWKSAEVQTSDDVGGGENEATPYTVNLADGKSYLFEVKAVAQSTDKTERAMFIQSQGVYRDGVAVLQGNQNSQHKTRTSGQMQVTFSVTGGSGDVMVDVTQGNLDETIDWSLELEILELP